MNELEVSRLEALRQRVVNLGRCSLQGVPVCENGLSLAIVDEAIRSAVPQLGFPSGVVPGEVGDNGVDSTRDRRRDFELALGPGGDELVEIVWGPAGRVPAIVQEELDFAFVWLEVSDIDDPELRRGARNSERQLLMDLLELGTLQKL